MVRTSLFLGLALLCGCGFTPSPGTNTASASYQSDLQACQSSVAAAVDGRNAKTGLRWMASGVTRWGEIDGGVDACMDGKGWGRTRACTAEELRTGGGGRRVTSRGVECSDPGKTG